MDAGIPKAISDMTLEFHYNDLGSLIELFDRSSGPDRLRRDGGRSGHSADARLFASSEGTLRGTRSTV